MVKEKLQKMVKVMFTGLTMALCVTAFTPTAHVEAAMLEESESNDTPATANSLPLNTWMRGVSQVSRDEDWYQITIPQSGASQVHFLLLLVYF